jgi:hypothetical protein
MRIYTSCATHPTTVEYVPDLVAEVSIPVVATLDTVVDFEVPVEPVIHVVDSVVPTEAVSLILTKDEYIAVLNNTRDLYDTQVLQFRTQYELDKDETLMEDPAKVAYLAACAPHELIHNETLSGLFYRP